MPWLCTCPKITGSRVDAICKSRQTLCSSRHSYLSDSTPSVGQANGEHWLNGRQGAGIRPRFARVQVDSRGKQVPRVSKLRPKRNRVHLAAGSRLSRVVPKHKDSRASMKAPWVESKPKAIAV